MTRNISFSAKSVIKNGKASVEVGKILTKVDGRDLEAVIGREMSADYDQSSEGDYVHYKFVVDSVSLSVENGEIVESVVLTLTWCQYVDKDGEPEAPMEA